MGNAEDTAGGGRRMMSVQQPCVATDDRFWACKILSPLHGRCVDVSDKQDRGVGKGKVISIGACPASPGDRSHEKSVMHLITASP